MDGTALPSIKGIQQDLRDIRSHMKEYTTQWTKMTDDLVKNFASAMDSLIRGIQQVEMDYQKQQKDLINKGHENGEYMEKKEEEEINKDSPTNRSTKIDYFEFHLWAVEFNANYIQVYGPLSGNVGDNWDKDAGWNGKPNVHFIIWQDVLSSGGGIT